MKKIEFHRFSHFRLNFYHCMEDVLKEFNFFDFPANVSAEVLTGRTISVWAKDLLFRPTNDSASRIIKSGGVSTVYVS